MNSNITVYGFCLVLVIAGTAFWSYTMQIDEAETARTHAKQQLASAEEGVKLARGWYSARKEALALITAGNIIEEQNEQIRAEVNTLLKRRQELAKAFLSAIERARDEMIGKEIPEMVLASGTKLEKARIQSVDPDMAVILHSGGISKVSTALLPAVLLDRFRFGYLPEGVGDPTYNGTSPTLASAAPVVGGTTDPMPASTQASDSLVRLGMDQNVALPDKTKKKTIIPKRDPARIKVDGDPALWKSVQRTSVGRAYIPGQGWLRIGPNGPIPGSARN
ncbi:MAG: hypothetical protein LDL31_06345 [Prosthecobacter sp.]|nr:hypothetical protein [Prosthecobacter sp.]